jgi:hypothetical protein
MLLWMTKLDIVNEDPTTGSQVVVRTRLDNETNQGSLF